MEDATQHEQASPEIQARIRKSFDSQGLMAHLGARLTHIGPGRVHIELPARPEVTQQHGYFHAGATSAVADSAGGYAAFTLFPEDTSVLSVEYKINLLAPAVGDRIEAIGTVLRPGRTLTVCRLEVLAVQEERRKLVASGQQTLIRVD
ncbi:PaaI family thioesterase [Streptomyces sp. TR06-5]|uniref:PaaI family thioesterase n=1 Tax=Streptomyces sp. TR06-5 TaxID=3385976 RepID=UPI00399F6288